MGYRDRHRPACIAIRHALCLAVDLPGNERIRLWYANDARLWIWLWLWHAHADDGLWLWFLWHVHVAYPAWYIGVDRAGHSLVDQAVDEQAIVTNTLDFPKTQAAVISPPPDMLILCGLDRF